MTKKEELLNKVKKMNQSQLLTVIDGFHKIGYNRINMKKTRSFVNDIINLMYRENTTRDDWLDDNREIEEVINMVKK